MTDQGNRCPVALMWDGSIWGLNRRIIEALDDMTEVAKGGAAFFISAEWWYKAISERRD